jgi:tetratricopeptide (TPR) repeat protein
MFVKVKSFVFLLAGIAIVAGSIYWCFHIPSKYSLWPRIGLEKVAMAINPEDPDLFLEIGNGYFGHGKTYDIRKAEKAYVRAIELRPDFLEAHYQLGRIHFIDGRFESALAEIGEALRLDPDFRKAYYMYGLISGYKGDLDQAVWGFSEFIKRDDFNWAGYNDLAWIYFKKGDYRKMKEAAEEGLRHAKRNPWLNNIYGTALMNLGEKDAAREAFAVAIEESEKMTSEDWGKAYPGTTGNHSHGIEETRSVIGHNLSFSNLRLKTRLPNSG